MNMHLTENSRGGTFRLLSENAELGRISFKFSGLSYLIIDNIDFRPGTSPEPTGLILLNTVRKYALENGLSTCISCAKVQAMQDIQDGRSSVVPQPTMKKVA